MNCDVNIMYRVPTIPVENVKRKNLLPTAAPKRCTYSKANGYILREEISSEGMILKLDDSPLRHCAVTCATVVLDAPQQELQNYETSNFLVTIFNTLIPLHNLDSSYFFISVLTVHHLPVHHNRKCFMSDVRSPCYRRLQNCGRVIYLPVELGGIP
jgi:hypothetical protein